MYKCKGRVLAVSIKFDFFRVDVVTFFAFNNYINIRNYKKRKDTYENH